MSVRMLIVAACALLFTSAAAAEEPVDLGMVNRIVEEATRQSEVMDTLGEMSDGIGERLTGAAALTQADQWALGKFQSWGLKNAHLESYPFGHDWRFEKALMRMTAPRLKQMYGQVLPWTPGTGGPIEASLILGRINDEDDFEKYRGKLAGKIVLMSKPRKIGSVPSNDVFERYDDKDLARLKQFDAEDADISWLKSEIKNYQFARKLYDFLKEEGAVAVLRRSRYMGQLVTAEQYQHMADWVVPLPLVTLSYEDYNRLTRLMDAGYDVKVELDIDATVGDQPLNANSAIAEIPGNGDSDEIVMAGAHFDSWFYGNGAVDNGAGSAIVMEAARILSSLGVKPRRTIRFALWSGEEEAFFGSLTYVMNHFATRPAPDDADLAALPAFTWFANQWPLELKPEHARLSAYFNIDNGSGKLRGVYAEGNFAAVPIFEAWLKPFHNMGADTVTLQRTGGTDHLPFDWVGLPGFQFIQDPLQYETQLHHTQIDVLDYVQPEDMRQASAILASFLYNAAMREGRFPRKPLPRPAKGDENAAQDADQ